MCLRGWLPFDTFSSTEGEQDDESQANRLSR